MTSAVPRLSLHDVRGMVRRGLVRRRASRLAPRQLRTGAFDEDDIGDPLSTSHTVESHLAAGSA